jgi:hypothetical protein
MGIITRNLLPTCLEEIQDLAEQTNLQALQKLTRGGLSILHPRAVDSLGNSTPGEKVVRKKSAR